MVADVLAYLGSASAAGVLGNSTYAAVVDLTSWMRDRLGWREGVLELEGPLDANELIELRQLFHAATAEWRPARPAASATQTISVGRDMNAPAINIAGRDPEA